MAAKNIPCKQFTDFLIRRAEHFGSEIIRDVTPTDGWIGHVETGIFTAFDGVTKQWDRFHRVYPDLSGAWQNVVAGNCIGTPCDPPEQKIGFGFTQEEYRLQQKAYATDLFCFDHILSADRAREQFSHLISNILRPASNIIISDRMRREAFRMAKRKVALAANLPSFTVTLSANEMEWTPSVLPTSRQTIQALQRFVQPLILEGAQGVAPGVPLYEYVTDQETAWGLREGNADLTNAFRFTDFARGGELYKYGITDAIGNFGIRIDQFPLRFIETGGVLHRVMPYTNIPASGTYGGNGIRGEINDRYVNAPYQLDYIWDRRAMRSEVRDARPINSMMPFAARSFGGQWQFVMDNLGADENGCVINNERRNKGKFIADFEFATKDVRPEWVVAFLILRQRSCFEVEEACDADQHATFAHQDYNSANDVCETEVELEHGTISSITIATNSISCNGVVLAHPASGSLADQDAVVVWLNENMGSLGTWSVGEEDTGEGGSILLNGQVCQDVIIPALPAAGT